MKSLATSPDLHLDLKRLEKSKCKSGRKAVGIFSKASDIEVTMWRQCPNCISTGWLKK